MSRKRLVGLIAVVLALNATAQVQQSTVALPRVSAAEVPLYPRGAVHASIEGVVQMKITTDGHSVVAATTDEHAIPLLAHSAEANVRTWRFDLHEPVSFTVIYTYRLVRDLKATQNNARVILRLPTEVEVEERRFGGTVDMPTDGK